MIHKQVCKRLFGALFVLLLLVSGIMGGRSVMPAFADTGYTGPLEDLQKDVNFNVADYPDRADDYSIQLIQVAESTDGELFVYTYQPCPKTTYLVATEINMSLSESVDGTRLYSLTLLKSNGVFCKYKVNGFTVSEDETRFYNITSIYREWLKDIDKDTGNNNTKNAVAFTVGKCFMAKTENGVVSYFCKSEQVIQILNPYSDYLRYSDGYHWEFITGGNWQYTDVHYIAFDTDLPIDTLIEADVSFWTQPYHGKVPHLSLKGSKTEHEPITVRGEEKGGNPADGFLAKKYEWKRIQHAEDFIKTDGLRAETIENVKNLKWVLMFYETEVTRESGLVQGNWSDDGTYVTDVTILRLKFMTANKVYNLGVVSDKVTGDDKPGNSNTNELASFWEWLERVTGVPQWVWKLIFVLIVLAIALPVLSIIFPVVGQVLLWIVKAIGKLFVCLFKGLWWLICLPFKGIAVLVRKIRGEQ